MGHGPGFPSRLGRRWLDEEMPLVWTISPSGLAADDPPRLVAAFGEPGRSDVAIGTVFIDDACGCYADGFVVRHGRTQLL